MMEKGAFGNKKKNAGGEPAPAPVKKEKPTKEKKGLFGGKNKTTEYVNMDEYPPADDYAFAPGFPDPPKFGQEPPKLKAGQSFLNKELGGGSPQPVSVGGNEGLLQDGGLNTNQSTGFNLNQAQVPVQNVDNLMKQQSQRLGVQGPEGIQSLLNSQGLGSPNPLPNQGVVVPSPLNPQGLNQPTPLKSQGLSTSFPTQQQGLSSLPPLGQSMPLQVNGNAHSGSELTAGANMLNVPQMQGNILQPTSVNKGLGTALPNSPQEMGNPLNTQPQGLGNLTPLQPQGVEPNIQPNPPANIEGLATTAGLNASGLPESFTNSQMRVSPEVGKDALGVGKPPSLPGMEKILNTTAQSAIGGLPTLEVNRPTVPVFTEPTKISKDDLPSNPLQNLITPNIPAEGLDIIANEEKPSVGTVSSMISANTFSIDMVSDLLNKEQLARTLLNENSVYTEAIKAMESLELDIKAVYLNKELSTTIKIQQIKDLLFKKMNHRDVANNILVQRFLDLASNIVYQMERAAEERIDFITSTISKTRVSSDILMDSVKLSESIQKRTELRNEAQTLLTALKNVYEIIHDESAKVTEELLKDVPSEHTYINQIFSPVKRAFLPPNTHAIASAVLSDLQRDASKFKAVEMKLQKLMDVIYQFGIEDEKSLKESDRALAILQNNTVEKLVVPKTILQARLRVFIGCSNVGSTATMVTVAGRYARRGNTLSLNLSRKRKLGRYGISPISVQEFLDKSPRKENLFIEEFLYTEKDFDRFRLIMNKVSEKLGFFTHVNIFLDETQTDFIKELEGDILSLTMITDTSADSMETICSINKQFSSDNMAKRMVIIDAVEDMVGILESLQVDLMTVKIITLPHSTTMRQYGLLKKPPYLDTDIGQLFDVAFIE